MSETLKIQIPMQKLNDFCKKWKVKELSFFGSVLRDDFSDASDIDVLIDFQPNAAWGWDVVSMKEELEKILERKVDMVTKPAILNSKNPYRKKEILDSSKVIYEQVS